MRINSGSNCFNPDEKAKPNISCYEPTVIDLTKIINGKIEITVKDKGNGFPDAIKEKIFQPFFTTKPTGQGTGLGLLSFYDIIKVHGGEIKVDAKENEGTQFIIQLPFA
jgi:signal transduction histidine kinase